ncbi:MAG: hypothetical protein R2757_21270 [Draconibacterium sp.]
MIFRKLKWSLLFILIGNLAIAQAPDVVPYGEPEPLELTLFNIILYIVVPVLLFTTLIVLRLRQRKKENKKQENKKN